MLPNFKLETEIEIGNRVTEEKTVNKLTIVVDHAGRDVEYRIRLTNDGELEIIKSTFNEESSSISVIPCVSNHIKIM